MSFSIPHSVNHSGTSSLTGSFGLTLDSMRDALARAGVAGVAVLARDDASKEDVCPVLYVPLLALDHTDFDEAYGLLCCHWIPWLRVAHCCLRVEATHVVACFRVDALDQQTFDVLLVSIKKAELCFI